jgi:hypothetical protein
MAPNLGVPMAFRAERLTFAAAEDGDRGRSDIPAELDQGAPDIIDTSAGAPSGDDREASWISAPRGSPAEHGASER